MNFLRNSFSSSDLRSVSHDTDRDDSVVGSFPSPARAFDSDGEDARAKGGTGEFLRTRNRVVIQDHTDVPADCGGILVPYRELPTDWYMSGDLASVMDLDRTFVFPGERLNIVVYVSSNDDSMPEITTPFSVAAAMGKTGSAQQKGNKGYEEALSPEILDGSTAVDENRHLSVEAQQSSTPSLNISVSESLLRMEGHKKSAALLQSFQNSHFFTRIAETDEQAWKKQPALNHTAEEFDDGMVSANTLEHKNVPLIMEGGDFDPKGAGGVARNASCYSIGNAYTAVVLQVTVATDLKNDVVLEVLQFEQPWRSDKCLAGKDADGSTRSCESYSNSSEQLLQWLLPLDRPSSPPLPTAMPATPASFVSSSPQRPSSSSTSTGTTFFSFANLRTSSSGSTSQNNLSSVLTTPPHLPASYGLDELERPARQKILKGQSVGSEGLLSFRGAHLEPQRFSVHCGLEGLYVPGRRWRRKVRIVEPVAIESYYADCNTKDLICVLIENVVPDHLPEIVIMVDSISIVCQSAGRSGTPLSLPLTCIEVGEDHRMPGLSLRPGEQHSLILKPSNSPFSASVTHDAKVASKSSLYGYESNASKGSYYSLTGAGKMKAKEHKLNYFQDSGSYALVVSCRCSHTYSRLHFKHSIEWKPRAPSDILLSVSLNPTNVLDMQNGSQTPLMPQVLTVQATNLTSENLHLTLLAPSSKSSTSFVPPLLLSTPAAQSMNSFMSFHGRKEWSSTKKEENDFEVEKTSETSNMHPGSLQRSMSLPPVKPIESIMGISPRVVKERAISAADIAAENSSARTHLWLQSTIPLGSVPPQSTTAVRCELLPLTDGIITLDTLHISTNEQDAVYFPGQPLQIYATSSISSGLS